MALTQSSLLIAVGTILAAVVPAAAYAAWLRNQEVYEQEPWGEVVRAFAWGGTGGILLALLFEVLIGGRPELAGQLNLSSLVFTTVIVAPVVEEATKAVGLRYVEDPYVEPEDGLIYGAAAGLGFAATENLVYAAVAMAEGGLGALVGTLVLRTLTSALLHATASALVGYAIWRRKAGVAGTGGIVAFYLGAVALHAGFNLGVSLNLAITAVAVGALAIYGFLRVRKRIQALDAVGGPRGLG